MTHRRLGHWGGPGAALLLASVLLGCGHDFEPPSTEGRIREAEELYTPQLFDTITWASPRDREREGNVVFASKCRNCHGVMGEAGTAYARQRQLDVPSLVEPDWAFDGDLEELRHHVFVGHTGGMPTWGVAGITPREIDAVAHYVLDVLRPEVLGEGGA